jgi:hypothetical protein
VPSHHFATVFSRHPTDNRETIIHLACMPLLPRQRLAARARGLLGELGVGTTGALRAIAEAFFGNVVFQLAWLATCCNRAQNRKSEYHSNRRNGLKKTACIMVNPKKYS